MKYVLIADDEDELAQSIRNALGSQFKVDIVNSGLEVIKLYRLSGDHAKKCIIDYII
jgi:CheY-like chemotaxis protein